MAMAPLLCPIRSKLLAAMTLTPVQQQLKERFFNALLEAALPLQDGPDQEVTLELLIDAAAMLREHLEHELEVLRQEQAE